MGPVGHAWLAEQASSTPLYRCKLEGTLTTTYFVHTDSGCNGAAMEELLGFALSP